ncbi:MAG: diguanylate cyclase [Methylocystis sp.]|jgi:diguanylate cyclase (GGDEF)-like protein
MLEGAKRLLEPRTKKEAIRLVYLFTAIAIAVALMVTVATSLWAGAPMGLPLIRSIVIPLMLAPWMVWTIARFSLRLEEMRIELERLVREDPLSGALNRRGVMEFANKAFAEQEEIGLFSAVVIDIDRFKDINDNYGHAAGDAVIARVVEIARRIAGGKSCAVGRLGGDELVVLIVGQSLEETMITAERLRQAIEHTVFMHEDRRLMATTSIGVAAADPADQSAEAVLRRADQSLYAAKSAGRNRVRSAA